MEIYRSAEGKLIVEDRYRAALSRWPVSRDELRIPTSEGDTFVIASGGRHAPPLVLLHGSGTNSGVWIRDIAEWSERFRVYAIDIIGEPGLSAPSRPPLASDRYAPWLDAVFAALALERPSIVGVSLGGWLAVDYAVRRPDRVASLSLISPSGIGGQNRWPLVKAGVLLMLGPWGVRKALQVVAGGATVPQEAADALVAVFKHYRPRMERIPIRSDRDLARLTMPVQLIVGGQDALLRSHETRERLARTVPHVRTTFLPDAGHLLPRQTAVVANFVASVSCGRVGEADASYYACVPAATGPT